MPDSKKPRRRTFKYPALLLVLLLYVAYSLARPLPFIQPTVQNLKLDNGSVLGELAWPAQGQAAVGVNPSGVLASHGQQTPVPIASTAKVLTALCVLQKRPIAKGQTGPLITISAADVALYNRYVAADGSVLPVSLGEQLSEYQMLQAIMLPSANNIADSLAIWAFGSLENYINFANNYVRQLGLTNTHVAGDASGLDPGTRSTAHDLVLLGEAAMQQAVLAEIAGQTSANLPGAGTVSNVNFLLGSNNIVGVKTGNTDEAGGVFIAAQRATVAGKPITIISAVAGTTNLYEALATSLPLLRSSQQNFKESTLLKAGAVVGSYRQPWGKSLAVATTTDLRVTAWQGATIPSTITLQPITIAARAGQTVGRVGVGSTVYSAPLSVPVTLTSAPSEPPIWWRLTHPL